MNSIEKDSDSGLNSRTGTEIAHDCAHDQDNIHVWYVPLKQPSYFVDQIYGLLSSEEKARAGRYHYLHLQQDFIVARGVLRLLLSRYTNLPAGQLEFEYLKAGKPILSKIHHQIVYFNLSHSFELALYSFSKMHPVGIDIEYLRELDDLDLFVERNFSAHEAAEFKTLPPNTALQGFFNCWTRKEAFLKAMGDGISFPLQEFDVSLTPGEPARLISVRGSAQEAERWSMLELSPAANYAAALVVKGNVSKVVYHHWNGLDQL